MADDIGDGVEWLQWLLTNDIEAVGGHRPSDMASVVRPAVIFCAANGGWMLSVRIEAKIGGIYVRRTGSRLEYGVKIRRPRSIDRTSLRAPPATATHS
jgi:hypothetical protein